MLHTKHLFLPCLVEQTLIIFFNGYFFKHLPTGIFYVIEKHGIWNGKVPTQNNSSFKILKT